MGQYFRIGNRTITLQEKVRLTPKDVAKLEDDARRAEEKRLENTRKSLGIKEPVKLTLDVTPAAIAARKAAIEAEEARIAAETAELEVELGEPGASFSTEGEVTQEPAKRGRKPKQQTV